MKVEGILLHLKRAKIEHQSNLKHKISEMNKKNHILGVNDGGMDLP